MSTHRYRKEPYDSGWRVGGIALPWAPETIIMKVNRTFQKETIFQYMPQIFKPTASAYDFTFTGKIFPSWKAYELEQLAKSADTETVSFDSPNVGLDDNFLGKGEHAIKNFEISRRKPMFISVDGRAETVFNYKMTLTQFADEGENIPFLGGDHEGDEDGVGFKATEDSLFNIYDLTNPLADVLGPISGQINFGAGRTTGLGF